MPAGDVQISATMEPAQQKETQLSKVGETSDREETEAKEDESKEEKQETVKQTKKSMEARQSKTIKEPEEPKNAKEGEKETELPGMDEGLEVEKTARATTHNFPQIQKSGQAIFKCDQVT